VARNSHLFASSLSEANMSNSRNRGGEPGDDRHTRGNDGNQEARDRGETGRYEDQNASTGAFGSGSEVDRVPGREDTAHRVKRQVHQEGEAPLPFDHEQDEWLGTEADNASPCRDGDSEPSR
jgi:hypothetical protein